MKKTEFIQKTQKGIECYQLSNDNGMRVQIISFGARIAKILLPTAQGDIDIVAGFDSPDEFMGNNPYFNAVIGRVANRIEDAQFILNGKRYELFKNDGKNHLHGGEKGFDSRNWDCEALQGACLKLTRLSADGEEGYPGNLNVSVTYDLKNDNSLHIIYDAVCDSDTVCSLTNHAYFNLDGDFESVLDHMVYINSDKITTVDEQLIPHGEFLNVKGTPYDFSVEKSIGKDIKADDFMLNIARGYDFNYVLNNGKDHCAASAYSNRTGVKMSVFTDRPCLQFYTGNFLDGLKGKRTYGFQSAFCMETQGFPNACRVNDFESSVLKKGVPYHTETVYKFEW